MVEVVRGVPVQFVPPLKVSCVIEAAIALQRETNVSFRRIHPPRRVSIVNRAAQTSPKGAMVTNAFRRIKFCLNKKICESRILRYENI